MRGRRLLCVLTLLGVVAACDGGATSSSLLSTTTSDAQTTTTFDNPFEDVTQAESHFSPGDDVDVVGLRYDEQNWVGSFPSDSVEFFGRLWEFDRLDAGLVSLGTAVRYQDGDIWEQFESDDATLAHFPQDKTGVLGQPADITVRVSDLEGASADELLALVADTIAADEGLTPIQITIREFGGRELYYDLIGDSDPTRRGMRLHVVVEETDSGFVVALVESSPICVNEMTASGDCA